MPNPTSLFTCTILACLPSLLLCKGQIGTIPDPEDIKKELYCIGCEYTVKALHNQILQEPFSQEDLDTRVEESLQTVCTEETFNKGDISPKKLLKACEFLIEENQELLAPLLVTHFSGSSGATYLDLSQQVCMDLSHACDDVAGEHRFPDHLDSDLEYDPKTRTFRVKEGRVPRIPEPIRSMKEDL